MKRCDTTRVVGHAGAFEANAAGRASQLSTEHLPPALSELQATRLGKECGTQSPGGAAGDTAVSAHAAAGQRQVALCSQRPGLEGLEMEEEV